MSPDFSLIIRNSKEVFDLQYKVMNHSFAQKWFNLFRRQSVSSLRTTSHLFTGFERTDEHIKIRIDRLNQMIELLTKTYHVKFPECFDFNEPQKSVNRLHIHFPDLEENETDQEKLKLLYEYNDLIHYIEGFFSIRNLEQKHHLKKALIHLSFREEDYLPIEENEFKLFNIKRSFGDVVAHYPHIGRHLQEIYFAADISVPDHQIVPQNKISPDSTFYFGTNLLLEESLKNYIYQDMNRFFQGFGVERLPFNLGDPRLAIGYVQVASLINDYEQDDLFNMYSDKMKDAELIAIRF